MPKRDQSIDFLKGFAILLMTITHINSLLYTGENIFLNSLTTIGVNLCFPLFLFCSSYIDGLKIQNRINTKVSKAIFRILDIYIVYIVLGIFISFVFNKGLTLKDIFSIVSLQYIPDYVDFLIAFIFFAFVPILFSKQLSYLLSKPLLLIILTIFLYLSGIYIFNIVSLTTFSNIYKPFIENIFGYGTLHRFPLTFYFPIYTFGLILSKYNRNRILILISIFSYFLYFLLINYNLSFWNRWPPSIIYLLQGYIYIPILILIFRTIKRYINEKYFNFILKIGNKSLKFFFISTFLIFFLRLIFKQSDNSTYIFFLNIIFLMLYPIVIRVKMI